MREIATAERIQSFMREFYREANVETRLYFTEGATAVFLGWRSTTISVNIRFFPATDRLFRAIPKLKEQLQINVELASPADFIPEIPGWEARSLFINREGTLSFYHYDLYAQALAKIERGHAQDLQDVREMIRGKWVEPEKALDFFKEIEPHLYRYPAINPASFRRDVKEMLSKS
jgi:hypothetical protein